MNALAAFIIGVGIGIGGTVGAAVLAFLLL